MNLIKSEWYFILFLFVLVILIWLNEIGHGAISFLPLLLLEVWVISKVYEKEKPNR